MGATDIATRAEGFGLLAIRANGCDFHEAFAKAGEAVEHCRRGKGPVAIEFDTERFYGHFEGDPQRYRAKDEVATFRETMDCLKRFRARVASEGRIAQPELDAIDADVLVAIDRIVAEAKAAPAPAEADLYTDVYIHY